MTVAKTAWSLIETPVVEITIDTMTVTEIAARRQMDQARFILWKNYLAASNLYMAMLGKPSLFDEDETDAMYETCRDLEDAHTKLDETYSRLYLRDPEEN